jgi:hypothetical protein
VSPPARASDHSTRRAAADGSRVQDGDVTSVQQAFDLWETPRSDHRARVVAESSDRGAWLRARARGVTATDAARLTSMKAVQAVALEKVLGSGFSGNSFTDHGRAREPEIARWVLAQHHISPNTSLFHAEGEKLHLATPDGVAVQNGSVVLAEIKTTSHRWRSIPRSYLRQVWWQQYVLGAERTLFVWEHHEGFVPSEPEPQCRWIDRDENEIHVLVAYAEKLLTAMARR